MTEKNRADNTPQKRSLKLSQALGDWTTYKPPRMLVKRVKTGIYGFDRLSKEELEQIHTIHYRFGEKFLETLRIDLGIRTEIYSADAIQGNYANFTAFLSHPVLSLKINLKDFYEDVFWGIDLALADSIINAALGSSEASAFNRPLTDAENAVIESVLAKHVDAFNQSFSGILSGLKIEIVSSSDITANPNVSPGLSYLYFVIEAAVNNSSGRMIFGYTGKLAKELLKRINQSAQPAHLKISRFSEKILSSVSQPLSIVLGKTEINSGDLSSLEPGDVLSLDQPLNAALPVYLDGKKIVLGQPGITNGKLSMKIISCEKDFRDSVKITPPSILPTDQEAREEKENLPAEETEYNEEEEKEDIPEEIASETESLEENYEDSPEDEFEEEYSEEEYQEEENDDLEGFDDSSENTDN